MSSILSLYKYSITRRTITICKAPTIRQRKHEEQTSKHHKSVRYYGKYDDDVCAPYGDPPRSRGRGILFFVGALLLASSAVIGYAKYDPKFRKRLVGVAPFTDDIMKVVFQEEKTYYEQFSNLYDQIKNVINLPEQRKK